MEKQKINYRIYYIDNDSNEITVKRFKSTNNKSAHKIFLKYKKDHKDNEFTYYFGTAGMYIGPDKKAYDTQEELAKKCKAQYKYDKTCRKMDIDEIESFYNDEKKRKYSTPVNKWDKLISKRDKIIHNYEYDIDDLVDLIENTDLETAPESIMDKIIHKIDKIRETRTQLRDDFSMIKNRHSIREYWDITHHIFHDLLYNIPILIKKKTGIPGYFIGLAKKDKKVLDYKPDDYKKGEELYNKELEKLLLEIRLYYFYSNYGIVDDNDKEMKLIYDKYKDTIPYIKDMYKSIDYIKLDKLKMKHWKAIWKWLEEYGEMLWD